MLHEETNNTGKYESGLGIINTENRTNRNGFMNDVVSLINNMALTKLAKK